jgi:glycosyltransferase involved in cell wall biosynthesis
MAKSGRNPSKNLASKKLLRIGIDARLAYQRGLGAYTANLILSLAKIDRKNEYFIFNAPEALRSGVANPRFHWVSLPFSNAALYEQILLPRAARKEGLSFLHYVDNSGATFSGFPYVLTLHDTMHIRSLSKAYPHPTLRQRLVYAYKQWAIPRSAQRARVVLTVSEVSRKHIVEGMGIDGGKVWVTPNGVDLKAFRELTKNPSKSFRILVHAATDERKNIPNILKAAQLLAGKGKYFQLRLMGMDANEAEQSGYPQEVKRLGLGPQVVWMGKVSSGELGRVYGESDLLLYPSRWEGFGLPVLEAFACGVPVVASDTTSLPEVAGNAALLVDPENPEAIANAVRRLMEKPALRRQLVQRGFKRARLFTWEKTARLTLKVYEGIKE